MVVYDHCEIDFEGFILKIEYYHEPEENEGGYIRYPESVQIENIRLGEYNVTALIMGLADPERIQKIEELVLIEHNK